MDGYGRHEVREVVVFRHNLFKVSEPFIASQAQHLTRYRPLYLGRLRFGAPPPGAHALVLGDRARRASLARIGWQMISRDPGPYVRLLRGRHPALIHAHFGIEGVYAVPLAKRLNVPLITTFHGFDATLATPFFFCSPAWAAYPVFRRQLARRGELFLCASAFIRSRLLALGFSPARTRVHYIGVDCRAIGARAPAEEEPVILHVARLVAVKGTEYLLRAFARLADRYPASRLVVIGDGPRKRALVGLSGTLGIRDRVEFLGALPHRQVLAWMRRAMMLVVPSIRTASGRVEGLGMVILEAAATGVPSVGSRLGGIPETIIDGETGLLTPERDAVALARHMEVLLGDADARTRMGQSARAFAETHFDIHRQTATLEKLYDAVIAHVL